MSPRFGRIGATERGGCHAVPAPVGTRIQSSARASASRPEGRFHSGEAMGKKALRIPDEVLREPSLWGLQRAALLTTPQVAFLIGMSVDQVKERRRTRPPKPPFPLKPDVDAKRGSAVWYALGDVLDYLRSRMPTPESARALSFASFSTFLSSAMPDDEWPFARAITGAPVDLIASLRSGDLTDPEEDCAWLSLADYLAQMGQCRPR